MKQPIFLTLIFIIGLCTITHAQVPNKLSYQGLLTKPTGVPVADGNYTLKIDIYDALSAGTLQHTETFTSVSVQLGRFTLTLGSVTPLPAIFTKPLWVQLTATAGPAGITYPQTISPRTELTSSPYSLAPWLTNGASLSYTGGKVGIGTASPYYLLDVQNASGSASIQVKSTGSGSSVLYLDRPSASASYSSDLGFLTAGNPDFTMGTSQGSAGNSDFSIYDYGTANNALTIVKSTANVGIGTVSPTNRLSVHGDADFSGNIFMNGYNWFMTPLGDTHWGFGVSNSGSNYFTDARVAGTGDNSRGFRVYDANYGYTYFFVGGGGNVGIGTTDPVTKLDVNGAITIRGGSDIAEPFETIGDATLEPGSVMVIDCDNPGKLKISEGAYDRTVAGVVSGAGGVRPGMILKQEGLLDGNLPIAIAGRVYCKAEAITSSIMPGDLLTTSATPGHCMKVTDHAKAQGAIIGKAMSGLKAGRGLVLMLVNLQ